MSGPSKDGIVQRPQPSSNADTNQPPSSDEEIYCPICNYNLTGILTGRCPECGSLFDRDALRASQQANRITLIPWDDPAVTGFWPRLKKTLPICLFEAKRFAFAFSVQPQESRSSAFLGVIAIALSVALVLICVITCSIYWFIGGREFGHPELLDFVLYAIAVLVSALISGLATTVVAAAILGVLCRHFDDKRHFKPWFSIAVYSSAHYLLVPLGAPLILLFASRSQGLGFAGAVIGYSMIWLGCALLNAFTLKAVVWHRGAKTSGRSFAVFLIFVAFFFLPILIQILVFGAVSYIHWIFVR